MREKAAGVQGGRALTGRSHCRLEVPRGPDGGVESLSTLLICSVNLLPGAHGTARTAGRRMIPFHKWECNPGKFQTETCMVPRSQGPRAPRKTCFQAPKT